MFHAQSSTFKDLLREQRRCYDNALMNVMNELLAALEESEVQVVSLSNHMQLRFVVYVQIHHQLRFVNVSAVDIQLGYASIIQLLAVM